MKLQCPQGLMLRFAELMDLSAGGQVGSMYSGQRVTHPAKIKLKCME